MRMKIHELAEGVYRHDHAGDPFRQVQRGAHEVPDGPVGDQAQVFEQFPVKLEVGPEHPGDGQGIMPVWHRLNVVTAL